MNALLPETSDASRRLQPPPKMARVRELAHGGRSGRVVCWPGMDGLVGSAMSLRIQPCKRCGRRYSTANREAGDHDRMAARGCQSCADFGGHLPSDLCRHPVVNTEHERGREAGDPCRQCIEGAARLLKAVREQEFLPTDQTGGIFEGEEED